VNESDDLEKKASPQKPPEDFRLPARLRDKLGDTGPAGGGGNDWEPARRSPAGAIITIVIVLVAIAGGWWWYQNHQARLKAEADRVAAEQAREKAVADSIAAAVAYADSVAAVARADSIAAFEKLPRWRQRQIIAAQEKAAAQAQAAKPSGGAAAPAAGTTPAAGGGAKAPPSPAPATGATEEPQGAGPFALDAGEFLFEAPAQRAAETLKASSGLDAVVAPVGSGDNAVYHVYLGRFSSRAAAVSAANDLLGKGVVSQARVVTAPK
jgi:hypothetical protein